MDNDTTRADESVAVAKPDTRASQAQAQGPAREPQRQSGQIEVNDHKAVAAYANFCRVTGTPEELIVDFGLNKNMSPEPGESIEISQRLIVNFYTAKRLLAALHMAVSRHEAAFGPLETDVQKRVVPSARPR